MAGTTTQRRRSARSDGAGEDRDLLGQYLEEIAQTPLLTKGDEVRLAQAIDDGAAAERELAAGGRVAPTARRELRRRVELAEAARAQFVRANLRLVVSIAKRYQHRGLPLLDLVQEGNLGLIHAVEKFDWRKGFKFSTYATWWIRQAIQRGIGGTGRTIRLPAHAFEEAGAVLRIAAEIEGRIGRMPTVAELAEASNRTEVKVSEILMHSGDVISLSRTLNDDTETELADVIVDPDALDVAEAAMSSTYSDEVERLLDVLDQRERTIVRMRYGLDGDPPRSFAEVGEELRLTRERIRQIEARALSKLRHPSNDRDARSLLIAS